MIEIRQGHVLEVLAGMAAESVQTCVTSPPYWGLRDYGLEPVVWPGGWEGSLGLEPTPDLFVSHMVEVFRAVRRVLRDDGTCWINLGESMSVGSSLPDEMQRLIEGSAVLIWNCSPVRMTSHCVHVAGDNDGPPKSELVPLLGVKRVTIKQGDDNLGQVLHLLNDEGYAWICPCVGTVAVNPPDLEIVVNHAQNARIVISDLESDVHTELTISRVRGPAGEKSDSPLAVEKAGKPISESIGDVEPVGNTVTTDAVRERIPKVDVVDEPVALTNSPGLGTGLLRHFKVTKAGPQQLGLQLQGGRQLRFSRVGHLAFLHKDRIVRYSTAYHDASGNASEKVAKQELGMAFRVRQALMRDGWICRSTIIWSKPNPMPESVTDRPTRAHEYVFLMSKSARYYYDADAVREPTKRAGDTPGGMGYGDGEFGVKPSWGNGQVPAGRNKRTVWSIATQAFPEAHFATFPEKLVEPCVLAGSSPKACGECGAPWERVVEKGELEADEHSKHLRPDAIEADARSVSDKGWSHEAGFMPNARYATRTTGWRPTCECCGTWREWKEQVDDYWIKRREWLPPDETPPTEQQVVLDPFAGSGTVGLVCKKHGRSFIGIELNPEYCEMAEKRLRQPVTREMFT